MLWWRVHCVCMCIHMSACVHACGMCQCIYLGILLYPLPFLDFKWFLQVHICMWVHVYIHIHVDTHMYVYTYCKYTHVYVYMYGNIGSFFQQSTCTFYYKYSSVATEFSRILLLSETGVKVCLHYKQETFGKLHYI